MFEAAATHLSHHDARLVGLAILISLTSALVGMCAYRHAIGAAGAGRVAWICLVAVVFGGGVWATHFMGMLAYHTAKPVTYEPGLTALSLLVAVAGLGAGAGLAARARTAAGRAVGGALCGATMATMHFIGMAGMHLPGEIAWRPQIAVAAVGIGMSCAAGAFLLASNLKHFRRYLGAVLLLALAICGLHFVAMAAIELTPTSIASSSTRFGRHELAWGVAVLVVVNLGAGVGMLVVAGVSRQAFLSSLRIALDRAPVAVAMFDGDHRLVAWNHSYTALIGAFGMRLSRGVRFYEIVEGVVAGGLPADYGDNALTAPSLPEWIPSDLICTPDGHMHQARLSQAGDGGFLVMVTDVSEHIALATREIEARQLAESASRAKSEFLANMSHEIRTPLNGILGMAQVLERRAADQAQRESLGIITDAGRSLMAVLDNVLDLSKIEAGKMELSADTFRLSDIIDAAIAPYSALAAEKHLSIEAEISQAAQASWIGDGPRLRQVLANLVSNAVKFTADGGVRIVADLAPDGVCLSVIDTGPGIARDKSGLIFEAFTQADASTTRKYGGTGLGLAISRQIVDLMGGTLQLYPTDGGGARFTVTLPLQISAETCTALPETAEEAPNMGEQPLRVLAADDSAMNRHVMKALLEPFDVHLTLAGNGQEAVDLYRVGPRFDLILMDIQMPVLNGIDATREIRRLELAEGLRAVPIIAVTANVMTHQVAEYAEVGMTGCVAKPIEIHLLLDAINAAMEVSQSAGDHGANYGSSAG